MAGRTISAANEAKLRAAMDALSAVMASMDGTPADAMKNAAKTKEAATPNLREAKNVGDGLEACIHGHFAEEIDDMFGDGLITREEWTALYAAVTTGLDAFRAAVTSGAPDIYLRDPGMMPDGTPAPMEMGMMGEAAVIGEIVPLSEAGAVRADGTTTIKLIKAGWGSSGFYPAEVLKRDGPNIFKATTKMYWDHQTLAEEAARPEGSLTNLAGELISDARWQDNGQAGPGLYADAKVFGAYKAAVNELAPHIGVSIRASGRTSQGEAEGRKGPIIDQLVSARSADFVTMGGAGGKIIEMFEAARRPIAAPIEVEKEIITVNEQQFKEAQEASQKQIDQLKADNARMAEGLLLRDAREAVGDALSRVTVPDVTRARLLAQLSSNPPIKEGALDRTALAANVAEAVRAEQAYLAEAAGYGSGRIEGMGDTTAATATAADMSAKLAEGFRAMGLSAEEALVAANGR